MRAKEFTVIVLLGLSLFSLALLPDLPKASACGTNTPCTNTYVPEFGYANNGGCSGCTGKTSTSITGLFSGDLLLVGNVGSDKTQSVTSITDTVGSIFKDGATYTGGNYIEEIWYAVIPSGCSACSDTVTSHLTGSQSNYYMIIAKFSTTSNVTRLSMHATTTSGTPLSLPAFNANDHSLTYGIFVTSSSVHGATIFQNPFTNGQCNNGGGSVFNCQGLGQIDDGYFYTVGGQNGVIMATGAGGSNDNVDGLEVNFDAHLSFVTVIVPCNFFQLQCWAYPMMYMGMWEGFFMGVGMAFKVSEKAFMYLLLAGATLGGLVEIQLGIMTPEVPIMLLVGNIAYSFRLDRVVFAGASAIANRGKQSK